jgi:large subunit ribosomal protein L13
MLTSFPKAGEITRKWFVVDAKDQVLGRLATHVANLLSGKLKPTWTPFMDMGDHVVIVNAEKIKLTGKKMDQKLYRHHTGYSGGLKAITAKDYLSKHPDRLVEEAVKGMLPKNKLGQAMSKKLKVYAGENHPHQAQQPEVSAIIG